MTTTTDEAADESRVATWLGLRFFGREKGRASLSSFLAPYSAAVPLLSFVFLFSGQRATRTNCGEEEVANEVEVQEVRET